MIICQSLYFYLEVLQKFLLWCWCADCKGKVICARNSGVKQSPPPNMYNSLRVFFHFHPYDYHVVDISSCIQKEVELFLN